MHLELFFCAKKMRYLTEFRDEDANSPIIYARTKSGSSDFSSPPNTQPSAASKSPPFSFPRLRKSPTYRVPWLTVTPGGEIKPKDLEDEERIGEPFGVCLFVLISPYFYLIFFYWF